LKDNCERVSRRLDFPDLWYCAECVDFAMKKIWESKRAEGLKDSKAIVKAKP